MNDELIDLLTEMPENRTAFIAALIMERCRKIPDCGGFPVARFNAYQATRIAQNLVKLAKRIHQFAEFDCNRGLNESEEKRYQAAQDKFSKLAGLCGFVATTGGDPRGACAYIAHSTAPDDGDDLGGRGWGVYR